MYVVSYQCSGAFSKVTNVLISLALLQFCTIVFYHFLAYTCHCNVVTTTLTVKKKITKFHCTKSNGYHTDLALLDIPERTYNYKEYRDGFVSEIFLQRIVHVCILINHIQIRCTVHYSVSFLLCYK